MVRYRHLDHNGKRVTDDGDERRYGMSLAPRRSLAAVMVTGSASPGTRQSVQVAARTRARGDQCSRDDTTYPMVNRSHGTQPDPWMLDLDPELRYHIQNCPCPCNHMGYGNFLDYQVTINHFSLFSII